MTWLRQPQRQVLDTLVEAGVARSRSEALAWCVRLVGQHADDWLEELREAMSHVAEVHQGPGRLTAVSCPGWGSASLPLVPDAAPATSDPLARLTSLEGSRPRWRPPATASTRCCATAGCARPPRTDRRVAAARRPRQRGARGVRGRPRAGAPGNADAVALASVRLSTELLGLAGAGGLAPPGVRADAHPGRRGRRGDARPARDAGSAARVNDLARTLLAPTTAPALVVAAVVHAELATAAPFVSHNGLVARRRSVWCSWPAASTRRRSSSPRPGTSRCGRSTSRTCAATARAASRRPRVAALRGRGLRRRRRGEPRRRVTRRGGSPGRTCERHSSRMTESAAADT